MRIASFLHPDIQDAIALWLSSLGHQLSQHTDTAERLVTDYQHLQQLNTQNCTLEPQHWLLIDSQLSTTQTIQALQRGCGYISTAPLDKTTLKDWLAGTNPLPNMLAIDKQTLPTPEADPRSRSVHRHHHHRPDNKRHVDRRTKTRSQTTHPLPRHRPTATPVQTLKRRRQTQPTTTSPTRLPHPSGRRPARTKPTTRSRPNSPTAPRTLRWHRLSRNNSKAKPYTP
jgi:hypothetical protein